MGKLRAFFASASGVALLLGASATARAQGAAAAPPAPPAPTASGQPQTAEETVTTRDGEPDVPWYRPNSTKEADPGAPTPPKLVKPPQPTVWPIVARYDLYGFTSGTVRGVGSALRAAVALPGNAPMVEVDLGIYLPNGAIDFGASVFRFSRYSFIPPFYKDDDWTVHVASGHLEVSVLGAGGIPVTLNGIVSPFGVRAASCSTQLVFDLRPTVGLWGSPSADSSAVSVGVSLSAGYFFSFAPKPKQEDAPRKKDKEKDEDEEQDARLSTPRRCVL